ncbi:MAG TPA: ribose-phosphate diphosphokinase, partial [Sphingomonadales bacterium]
LFAAPVLVKDIKERFDPDKLMIVSPDVGGVVRARAHAKRIGEVGVPLAIIDKRRERPGESEVMNIIGEVEGKTCLLVDDIVDTAGTLCNAADALIKAGATSVSAYVAHGVLSGKALERIENSSLDSLVITDSIKATDSIRACKKIRYITVAPLLGEAMRRISEESSVSVLFH